MTPMTYALAGSVFAVAALVNWWSVAVRHRRAMVVSKPLALAALIAVALAGGAASHTAGRWLLVGLVLCLAGDVFLLSRSDPAFIGGLTSFLLGHVAYVITFITLGLDEEAWALIGVMGMVACVIATRNVIPRASEQGGAGLAVAVGAYMLVIGAMAVTSWMTGEWLIGVGALTFVASDSMLALSKFVRARPRGEVAVMVTYHLGQVLIVAGVLAAT